MGEAKRRELVARQEVVEVLGLQSASGPLKKWPLARGRRRWRSG
jgi:hypothetical protein